MIAFLSVLMASQLFCASVAEPCVRLLIGHSSKVKIYNLNPQLRCLCVSQRLQTMEREGRAAGLRSPVSLSHTHTHTCAHTYTHTHTQTHTHTHTHTDTSSGASFAGILRAHLHTRTKKRQNAHPRRMKGKVVRMHARQTERWERDRKGGEKVKNRDGKSRARRTCIFRARLPSFDFHLFDACHGLNLTICPHPAPFMCYANFLSTAVTAAHQRYGSSWREAR